MAQSNNSEKNIIEAYEVIKPTNVMTGGDSKAKYLLYQLKRSARDAKSIDIMVSFLMESGVRMILDDLSKALDRGVKVRILTGNYLGITQPSALYLIKQKLGDKVDLRFYNEKGRSFHPKAYFFHYEKTDEVYIGSSNLSRSALTSGIEWNYRVSNTADKTAYEQFYSTFEDLFFNHSIIIDDKELKAYSKHWKRPHVYRDLDNYDEFEDKKVVDIFEPRGVQIEALCALENSRQEGADKGLLNISTGVGKTYIAAFDSKLYERVLFVAHREEILRQAAQAFVNVRKTCDYGFFTGDMKCTDKPVIFASVSSLGKKEYLNKDMFAPDYFDYIVIDEFHHAVNTQYRNIVEYFKPKFMLGLTATPERMDGKNIYEICDYNVPYEIDLKESINKGMLVPFHYYGIYDDTDYSKIHIVRGRYDEKELNETYIGNVHRHELIYKTYKKYGSRRALGFCCSRAHAEEMAREFCKRGIPSAAVYSNADGEYSEDRKKAVQDLKDEKIKVIFSVDMFNEGVDIPSVDMVMFLRPTESPTVFLQQLGRGLRKNKGKNYLNVLDFIGNYEKAGLVRYILTGHKGEAGGTREGTSTEYPDDCQIDFDLRLIDLFEQMEANRATLKEKIDKEFLRIESLEDKRPTRMDLFTQMDDTIYDMCMSHSKENIFKRYFSYLHELNRLSEDEKELYNGVGREFLSLIETTSMVKVYKMPVLMAFYNGGDLKMHLTEEDLLKSWKEFFNKGTNWKDLKTKISLEDYRNISDKAHLSNILKNPVNFLIKSGKGFFVAGDKYPISIREDMEDIIRTPAFAEQMKDIIEYRAMDYYRRRYREYK